MTDEECIALASLHGAELWGENGWRTCGEAAREYCRYHGLLEKVT